MNAFWISLAVFLVLLAGILWNIYYIHQSAEHLIELTQSLDAPERREDTLYELEQFWKKHRDLFGLSVGFRELDHFEELLRELRWAHDFQIEAEFQKYRSLLLDAIEEISRNEQISLGNIF